MNKQVENEGQFLEILDYYKSIQDLSQENIVALLTEVCELFGKIPSPCQKKICETLNIKQTLITALIKRFSRLKDDNHTTIIKLCCGPRCVAKSSLVIIKETEKMIDNNYQYELVTTGCMHKCKSSPNGCLGDDLIEGITIAKIKNFIK